MRVDGAAAKRFVTAAIPLAQRHLPSTSAAGAAQVQARRAVDEQVERMGMANRFRGIAGTGEKMGSAGEMDVDRERRGEASGDDEVMGLDGGEELEGLEGGLADSEGGVGETEAFLKGLESEMVLPDESGREGEATDGDPSVLKRKRGEEDGGECRSRHDTL